MQLPTITVRPGREKPLLQKHPWVFSGAILSEDKGIEPGQIVDIKDQGGRFLARGYANPKSKIRARALSFDPADRIDAGFFRRRIAQAVARRKSLLDPARQTAARLVMSEADLLPGLIVDRYGDWLVVQALTAGIDRHLEWIYAALKEEVPVKGIVERSDDAVRELEGLPQVARLVWGEEPPRAGVPIKENGLDYVVDALVGHKTGFYLDQRTNHQKIRAHVQGKRVLDVFCYTGGFTLNAAAAGAKSVLSVDASEPALDKVRANLALNGFTDPSRYAQRCGNAFEILRDLEKQGESFDVVILDPPKFAASGAQVDKAARGYKDINLTAFKLLNKGGVLSTYSCSGHVSADLFQKIVFGAALDAGRDAQIIDFLYQADDHPVLLTFPESLYLKGLLCRVL
jgi:23S rRNA (cytosine1962-C5)-methyltransferase